MERFQKTSVGTGLPSGLNTASETGLQAASTEDLNLIETLTDEVCDKITESLEAVERTIERRIIIRVLKKTGGNMTKAAQILGVKRPTLNYKIKKLKIKRDR